MRISFLFSLCLLFALLTTPHAAELDPQQEQSLPEVVPAEAAPASDATPEVVPEAVPEEADPAAVNDEAKGGTAYEELAILTEALMHVRRTYVEELSFREILFGALEGMLQGLDPYSDFMPPEEFEAFEEDTEGMFTGVGLQLGLQEGVLTVIAPIDGSPAYRAGVIAGDRIVKVNGKEAYDLSVQEAVSMLRGKEGDSVVLTLARRNREPFDVTLMRMSIVVPSVRGATLIRPGIGYVRITKFDEQTMPALRDKIDSLQHDGMKALVLDLRSNPGGLMRMAIRVAELFLERGKVVVSVKGRHTNGKSEVSKAAGVRPFTKLPLAVLVDQGSASASEVVAGALQDHHRGVLFGQKTFGKASVQTIIPLRSKPDYGLRLTTAHYYTPSGRMIHGKGIDPDIVIETTAEERVQAQLRRAYEESPEFFPQEASKEILQARDLVLDRAVDVLAALVTLGAE